MLKRFTGVLLMAMLFASVCLAQTSTLTLPPYKKVKLQNGLTLLLLEQHEVPLVNFSFNVRTGSTADPPGKEGVASLTAGLLRKGTKTRSADEIASGFDFIGAQFGVAAGYDFTSGRAEFVAKDLAQGLTIFADCLLNANFPATEFEKLRKQSIDGIKSEKDRAQGVIGEYFNAYLFGAHPYGRPPRGDEKTLAALSREDLAKFYDIYYTPSNTILAVAGDFKTAEMEKLLRAKFGAWRDKPAPAIKLNDPQPVSGKRLLLVDKPDSTQTYYQIGNVGIARTNADRVYINVVNTLFGGRFTSLLNDALRVNSGLTYGAGSRFEQRKVPGPFVISTYTRNATTEKALDLTLETLTKFHERGISEQELQSAKNYIKGQFPPSLETSDQLANLIATLEFYGLDQRDINELYRKIDAMTLADAQRVIKQYYPLDNLVFVVIGKASEIEGIAKKYAAKLDTKSISQAGF